MSTNAPTLLDPKDPAETTDYEFDFSTLLASDENIVSYALETPDDLTKVGDSQDGKVITAYYSGGIDGATYRPRCKITTDSTTPRVIVRSLAFRCEKL
jgi:hypothetical protein